MALRLISGHPKVRVGWKKLVFLEQFLDSVGLYGTWHSELNGQLNCAASRNECWKHMRGCWWCAGTEGSYWLQGNLVWAWSYLSAPKAAQFSLFDNDRCELHGNNDLLSEISLVNHFSLLEIPSLVIWAYSDYWVEVNVGKHETCQPKV